MSCNGFQPKAKNRRGVKSRKISSHGEHFNRSAEKKTRYQCRLREIDDLHERNVGQRNIMEGLEQDNWTKSIDWWLTGLPDWFKAGFFANNFGNYHHAR